MHGGVGLLSDTVPAGTSCARRCSCKQSPSATRQPVLHRNVIVPGRRYTCSRGRTQTGAVKEERDVEAEASPISSDETATAEPGTAIELDPESEEGKKQAEAERLRSAERFMVVGSGEATCPGCGYEYNPKVGDSEYPISPGTLYQDLPEDWACPICGAGKEKFRSRIKTIAGFAENQGYGLGTNSLTSGQKGALIYGSLLFFFALFLGGYFLE